MAASYKRFSKEQLLSLCEQRGIDSDASKTKEHLITALMENDQDRSVMTPDPQPNLESSQEPASNLHEGSEQRPLPSGLSPSLQAALQCLGDCDPQIKLQLIMQHQQAEAAARQAEAAARQAEREAAARQAEREAAARQAEREERQAERQFQLDLARIQGDRASPPSCESREVRSSMPSFDRFPVMDPNSDMDVYLRTFERTCRQFHLPRDQWARYLTPGLKGKALEVFADLPMDCDGDYDKIKEALVKRYNLTLEVYRKRFRTVQRSHHDSYADVLSNLRTAFNQWVRGLSISTFADLADLMIKDQLLHICSADVRQFILTKEPKTSDQAADFADLYVASRVQDVRRSPPPLRKEEKTRDHPPSSADRMPPRSGPNTSGGQAVAIDARRCYVCKKTGHLSHSCPDKMNPNPHEKSTASHAVLWVSAQIPHPVDNLQPVTVSNQLATGLRDSGAEITLVHPKLISQKDIIPGKTLTVTGIGGRNPTLAMARVYLDWGAGCGMREVGVSASLPADVLLGTDLGRMMAHYVPATTSTDTSAPPADQVELRKDSGFNRPLGKEQRGEKCILPNPVLSTVGDPCQTQVGLPAGSQVKVPCQYVMSGDFESFNVVPSPAAVTQQQSAQEAASENGKEEKNLRDSNPSSLLLEARVMPASDVGALTAKQPACFAGRLPTLNTEGCTYWRQGQLSPSSVVPDSNCKIDCKN
ncbi:uncharacterized protein PAF06_005766 [Gastrophryne carolinensis]